MTRHYSILSLTVCLLWTGLCSSNADTIETVETTVQRTTTNASSSVVALPSSGTYLVVDPLTGLQNGRYDPVTGLVDGRTLQAGLAIVDRPTGNVVAIIDSDGRPVDVGVAPASEVLMVSIDTRRRDLDQKIAAALNSGQLSATEAGALRAELERIAALESGGTVSYRQALVVAYNLNGLAQRLYPTTVVTPVIAPQFVVVDQRLTMVDDVTYRKMQLLRRIDDEYQAGRLSGQYVSNLKAQIDKVSSLESRYRRRGELSASRSRALAVKLDQVQSTLGRDVAVINERRARIGIRSD